jgi:hypothetical protein
MVRWIGVTFDGEGEGAVEDRLIFFDCELQGQRLSAQADESGQWD